MKMRGVAFVCSLAVALAACDSAPPPPADVAAQTEYMTVGTLNSVNADAGTVNISHSPVPAAGWPAMTMDFKLTEPNAAAELKPGQRVDIHFTIESGMNATITHIEPVP
jgi:Cu(I)/Ag(I) efflux system membrane fusion protein